MRPISKKLSWALGLTLLALLFIFLSVSAQENQPYGPPTWPYKVYPGSVPFRGSASWDYQDKHTGIDLKAPAGTPIYSSCTGMVIFWGNWQGNNGWINTIWVDCQDGNFFGYTHLDNLAPHVNEKDHVNIGQQIAVTGPIERSGIGSDDHLHWMRSKTNPRNGLSWIFTNPTEGVNLSRNPSLSNNQAQSAPAQAPVVAEQVFKPVLDEHGVPEKPTAKTVAVATVNNLGNQNQLFLWLIAADLIITLLATANRNINVKAAGLLSAVTAAAFTFLVVIQPTYAKQSLAYNMDTAPRQINIVEVTWEINASPPASTSKTGDSNNAELSPNQTPPSPNGCSELSKFPLSVTRWCTWIKKYANNNNLDPALVAAMIWQESGGNPNAYSHSGATGLIQVMASDGLSAQLYPGMFDSRPTMAELKVPEFNIRYSTAMMNGLRNKYGSIREALFRYGPADVGYYYADLIINLYNTYKN